MMIKLSPLCWIFLFGICLGTTSPHAAEPLGLYGYYHSQTFQFGFLMDEVADFTNVLILEIGRFEKEDDVYDKVLGIPRALELGYHIFLGFEGFSIAGRLRPEEFEAQVGLTALKLRQAGFYRPELIYGIFMVDEPPNRGLTFEDQELFLEIVDRYFPGFPTMINYSVGQVQSPTLPLPEAIDLISFDAYFFRTNRSDLTRPAMEDYLESVMASIRRKAPGKPVLFIAQSFQNPQGGYFFPTNEQLSWQVDFALQTPEIIGLIWFKLGNGKPGGEGEGAQGTISFPDQLELERQIGFRLAPGLFPTAGDR